MRTESKTTLRYFKSDYHLAKRQTKETMKKLINKLFEWLGYVPKEQCVPKDTYDDILATAEDLQFLVDWHDMSVDDIHKNNVEYYYEELLGRFLVSTITKDTTDHTVGYPLKVFHFTEETRDYARICAEELCEKLNEKY